MEKISLEDLSSLTNKWIPELGKWYLHVLIIGLWNSEIEYLNDEKFIIENLKLKGLELKDLQSAILDYFIISMTDKINVSKTLEKIIEIAPNQDNDSFHEVTSSEMINFRKRLPSVDHRNMDIVELARAVRCNALSFRFNGFDEYLVEKKSERLKQIEEQILSYLEKNPTITWVEYQKVNPRIYCEETKTFFETRRNDLLERAKEKRKKDWYEKFSYLSHDKIEEYICTLDPSIIPEAREYLKSFNIEKTKTKFSEAIEKNDREEIFQLLSINDKKVAAELRKVWRESFQLSLNGYFPEIISDEEKTNALSHIDKSLLVTARAGSGKTTLLGLSVVTLIKNLNFEPEEIITLAFNRDAAEEIGKRVNIDYLKEPIFDNYATFHSLGIALAPCLENERILNDKDRRLMIIEIFKKILSDNPKISEEIYEFFRNEMEEFERKDLHLSDEEFYEIKRSETNLTLDGRYEVKSRGEKWIADFLFEHNISYYYEPAIWSYSLNANIHPDFEITLNEKKIIIEHWATSSNDKSALPDWFSVTKEEYLQQANQKIRIYNEQSEKIILVETNAQECFLGREVFEKLLKDRLEVNGLICNKKPLQELIREILRRQESKIIDNIGDFISKAQCNDLSPNDLRKLIERRRVGKRTAIFERLAHKVYEQYEQRKSLGPVFNIDFSDMLVRATKVVQSNQAKPIKRLAGRDVKPFSVGSLKYILIDEFQDFNPLFFSLINSITNINPSLKILAVGDDWQAINQFAGASDKYVKNFDEFFPNSQSVNLLTNYRSKANIINHSNSLMKGKGEPSVASDQGLGKIFVWPIDKNNTVTIEGRNIASASPSYQHDMRYRILGDDGTPSPDRGFLRARYIKKICQIIVGNGEQDIHQTLVLFRTKMFRRIPLFKIKDQVYKAINSSFSSKDKFEELITFSTVHKSKGLEADLVIVVEANERKFPMMHPDNSLNSIFGYGPSEIYEHEKNLFYVACTRACQELHFLTMEKQESPFLEALRG